ncbi:TrmB family transcriptional regulator [Acidianus brierleyi]|uniref:TrmB family transcriptional regulator n=1 Tax=Acidianus brierleyi TaxID=41673 RepID=A0A2U9II22_9CREN|nr:helix-turn-helix domain-containing protein [Acidianus brierleyi]AWR95660.1 TrmB family transcriptional regulator [Acidianus brierleyi]
MSSELRSNLEDIGLSLYESKVYLSLLQLCSATMRELSEKSEVPYQKIYEVTRSLENKGLIKIIEGKPKRVKIIDPSIALKTYKDKIMSRFDNSISKIISFWSKERKGDTERSLHVAGKRTIIKIIKEFMEKSRKVKIVYDKPPEWLVRMIKQYKGDLTFITSQNIDINAKIKLVKDIQSRFIIFDDSLLVTFNKNEEGDEIIIDSCRGCIIQASEHFDLLINSIIPKKEIQL